MDSSQILTMRQTERGIYEVKNTVQSVLMEMLNLETVPAPLFFDESSGLQDTLDGSQHPVSFHCGDVRLSSPLEVVHSLAKWKRQQLGMRAFAPGSGLVTSMRAIRKDEYLDATHSIFVDQWDWEQTIEPAERSQAALRARASAVYAAVCAAQRRVCELFPALGAPFLPSKLEFVHAQELLEMFPNNSQKDRENKITEKFGAVFIQGIGAPLTDGAPHDPRAFDYDDFTTVDEAGNVGLNGDILVYNPVTCAAFELSSMGIRVDAKAIERQAKLCAESQVKQTGGTGDSVSALVSHLLSSDFHKSVINGSAVLSVGGGIGQSRVTMLLLKKLHIAEVQASVWPTEMQAEFLAKGCKFF